MDIVAVLILFFTSLLFSIYKGVSILYPFIFGLICFILISLHRGYSLPNLLNMMLHGAKKSYVEIKIFVLNGAITAIWRASGTNSFIV